MNNITDMTNWSCILFADLNIVPALYELFAYVSINHALFKIKMRICLTHYIYSDDLYI